MNRGAQRLQPSMRLGTLLRQSRHQLRRGQAVAGAQGVLAAVASAGERRGTWRKDVGKRRGKYVKTGETYGKTGGKRGKTWENVGKRGKTGEQTRGKSRKFMVEQRQNADFPSNSIRKTWNKIEVEPQTDHTLHSSKSHEAKMPPQRLLVGGFNPPEKYWSVGMIIPNIWETLLLSENWFRSSSVTRKITISVV